jgi:hypothetical protein
MNAARSHQKSGWLGKPAAEMRAELAAARDLEPVVTSCLFCRWSYTGNAGVGRERARRHRESRHPEATVRRVRRRRGGWRKKADMTPAEWEQASVDAAEANRARAEREEADKLATVLRGRLARGEAV